MANILHFEPRASRSADQTDRRGPAQIIFFSGVRYERLDDDAVAAPAPGVRHGPVRDVPAVRQG